MNREILEAPPSGPSLQEQARALGDPTRHRIFRYLADARRPVDVAEMTAAFGVHHNAVRQHLAKLRHAGLVLETTSTAVRRGRPKLEYRVDPAVDGRWGVSGPYERLSVLLAEMIRSGDRAIDAGRRAGRAVVGEDRSPAAVVAGILEGMSREGFAPELARHGDRIDLVLRRCPFETAALADPDTICELHVGMARGMAEGSAVVVDDLVRRDPRRAGCVVRLRVDDRALAEPSGPSPDHGRAASRATTDTAVTSP